MAAEIEQGFRQGFQPLERQGLNTRSGGGVQRTAAAVQQAQDDRGFAEGFAFSFAFGFAFSFAFSFAPGFALSLPLAKDLLISPALGEILNRDTTLGKDLPDGSVVEPRQQNSRDELQRFGCTSRLSTWVRGSAGSWPSLGCSSTQYRGPELATG